MKTTFVYRNGEVMEKPVWDRGPTNAPALMRDIQPFTTQDGKEITSRSTLREYERRNGVRQLGNDRPDGISRSEWSKLTTKGE